MHEKIADLEQQLSAANKALAELKPAHDDRTLLTAGHGDYFSKSQQQWVPLSDEFKLQIMWHETTAQKKFDVQETLNLPLQKCIFTEDGTPIADHVYRSMRTDAKELILLQLAGLPDQPMATKYRMLAFYKARYAPQLSKVCRTLSERWCELAMCANVWKARAMIGRALRAIGQVSVTDFRVADEAESSSTPSGGRSRLSSTWTTPKTVPSSPTKAPTSGSTSKVTIRARAVADAFGSNPNPPPETTTSAQPPSTPSTNPNPPPETTTSAQPPSTSSTAMASTSTLALTDRSNLTPNAASIPTPAFTLSGSQAPTKDTTSLSTSEVEAIDKNVAIALLQERNVTTHAREHARTITKLLVKSHVSQPIRQEDLRTATAAVSSAASKRRKGNPQV
ncbi:hypothetical protein A4X06_0g8596 [Tilletia controversa]|uniref:Uncharacterized protein n=2 Tax=Tilletia TaxID=13289 RepID=A0A8X7SSX4_9BASI|nr:hypothetical protein A4X06_0g8596 [Tilletia controversa]